MASLCASTQVRGHVTDTLTDTSLTRQRRYVDYNRFIECVDPDYTHAKDSRVANTLGGVSFDALQSAETSSTVLGDVLGQVQLRVSKRKIRLKDFLQASGPSTPLSSHPSLLIAANHSQP